MYLSRPSVTNQNYEPTEKEDEVLALFKEGRESGQPWGRANPKLFRERTSLNKGQVEYALRNLTTAGWITKLNDGGLYEFVADPREGD